MKQVSKWIKTKTKFKWWKQQQILVIVIQSGVIGGDGGGADTHNIRTHSIALQNRTGITVTNK